MSLATVTRKSPELLNPLEPSKMSFTKRVGQFLSDHKLAVLTGSLVIGVAYLYVEFFQGPVCSTHLDKRTGDIKIDCRRGVFFDACRLSSIGHFSEKPIKFYFPEGTNYSNLPSCLEILRDKTFSAKDAVTVW